MRPRDWQVVATSDVYGANRWDTVQFQSETDKEKFERLMGVKRVATAVPEHAVGVVEDQPTEREALSSGCRVLLQAELPLLTASLWTTVFLVC
jgi:hypothetical protein